MSVRQTRPVWHPSFQCQLEVLNLMKILHASIDYDKEVMIYWTSRMMQPNFFFIQLAIGSILPIVNKDLVYICYTRIQMHKVMLFFSWTR
jgi:hypothetical protein